MPLDMSRYLGLFVQEATEHLEALGRELVRLEREGHRPELVDSLFRHAHSVKGMAASMGYPAIASLAHRAEDLVEGARAASAAFTPEAADLLLASGDRLLEMVRKAGNGEAVPDGTDLEQRIAAVLARGGAGPVPAPRILAPEPLLVEATLTPSCATPGVRAVLVHKRLAALGRIARIAPSLEECKAGRVPGGRITAVLETAESPEAVRRAVLLVSELDAVEVRPTADPEALPRLPPDARAGSTVRVRTELLDGFLEAVGELILATSRLRELGRGLPERERSPVEEGVDALHRIVKDLQGKVMQVRMTPMALCTDRLPRTARDLARKLGRDVEVLVEGADIELDRAILEQLADPLVHLVRNCVDHGIESPAARAAAGKPSRGRISVRARRDRDRVIVEVEDDGRGLDPDRLRVAAVARGLVAADAARLLGRRELFALCLLPGVSTAETVSDLSGRGVGMDAVKRAVESLGGTLELDSVPGKGTRFVLRLPLTVAVVPLLLVEVAGEVFGLPIAKVVGAIEADPAGLDRGISEPLLRHGEGFVPVHPLAPLLGLDGAGGAPVRPHVVIEGDGGRLAVTVDRLVGQEEAVLKPVPPPLDLLPGLLGVTVRGTGEPLFILDVPRLLAPA